MSIYVGQQLQALPGEWDNNPTSFAYQWQDSPDGAASPADLVGETRSDYIADVAEIGKWVRVNVTGTNAAGSSSAQSSEWVGPVVDVAFLTGIWGIAR